MKKIYLSRNDHKGWYIAQDDLVKALLDGRLLCPLKCEDLKNENAYTASCKVFLRRHAGYTLNKSAALDITCSLEKEHLAKLELTREYLKEQAEEIIRELTE